MPDHRLHESIVDQRLADDHRLRRLAPDAIQQTKQHGGPLLASPTVGGRHREREFLATLNLELATSRAVSYRRVHNHVCSMSSGCDAVDVPTTLTFERLCPNNGTTTWILPQTTASRQH